jgi:hypothetical protein
VVQVANMQAWQDMLAGLDRIGRTLQGPGFPDDPAVQEEGFIHLAEQLLCWLEWSLGYGDPAQPWFQRQNDLITPWGGPNADNVYRHARVDPRHTYVIRGRMQSCEDFALAIRSGFRHEACPWTLAELTGSEIGVRQGDDFELILGGQGPEPNRVPLPESAVMCSIREYYFEWKEAEPATWTIERVDGTPASAPTYRESLAEALELTERSLSFWNDYMLTARARQEDNTFGTKIDVPKGLQISQFLFCFYDLLPEQALVVDMDPPDARYWSFQTYGLHFFRPFDIVRPSSQNHRQVTLGADGRVYLVLAAEDPGTPNWIDTGGRLTGLLNYRHFWGRPMPNPRARVVPMERLYDELPAGTPVVSVEERAAQIEARRRHLAWRLRT